MTDDAYRTDDGDDDFCMLHGPDGFCCRLGEPEDRIWIRDGKWAVDRLNAQHREIERLRLAASHDTDCVHSMEREIERLRAALASSQEGRRVAEERVRGIAKLLAEARSHITYHREEIGLLRYDEPDLVARIDVALGGK